MRDIEKYLILKTFLIFCRFNHSMKPIISQTASYDMLLLLIGADKLMNEMNERSSVHPFIVHPFIRSLNFY